MCDLEAYQHSLQPHRHDWQPLNEGDIDGIVWCPECGAVRRCPDPDS